MIVHSVSWIILLLMLVLSAQWIRLILDSRGNGGAVDGFGSLGFFYCSVLLGLGTLALGVIPSGLVYILNRHRRDLLSLFLAVVSLVAICIEVVIINRLPHTGAC